MHTENDTIAALHAVYVGLTGLHYPLNYNNTWLWSQWRDEGWNIPELQLVIQDTLRRNAKAEPRFKRSLHFNNLIGDTNKFRQWLMEAESEQRRIEAAKRQPRVDPERKSVLEATGRSAQPAQSEPVPAGKVDWIAELRKAVNGNLDNKNLTDETTNNERGRDRNHNGAVGQVQVTIPESNFHP